MSNSETSLIENFLSVNDFSDHTIKAITHDYQKWVGWFERANEEEYESRRVTIRDVTDFRKHLREERGQAVATVNRCLVTLRRYFQFLAEKEVIETNPAKGVKELRRTPTAPKAIERSAVRRLLREATVREDHRASAILGLFVYCGLRISEVSALKLGDIDLTERRGSLVVRHGKHNKERIVPVPIEARRMLVSYLHGRPPADTDCIFVGRGLKPLGIDGVRYTVRKYGVAIGIDLHPHALRHTFATQYLEANNNDIVGLAQILGHESIQTTSRYTQRGESQLSEASEMVTF
ncbi:integrase [bacterium]|nr:MAG: integrase [bacterium]